MDVILQQVYPGHGMEKFLELTGERHEAYANAHDFEFNPVVSEVVPAWSIEMGGWAKVELIRRALANGSEHIIWLDADAYIADIDADLRDGCPAGGIGAVEFHPPSSWGHHWNIGVVYLTNCEITRRFVDQWLREYPGRARQFEQGVFNQLGHGPFDGIVKTLGNEWNYTYQRHFNQVKPIVRGFHGSDPQWKYDLMKDELMRTKVTA